MNNVISFPRLGLTFSLNRAAVSIGGFSVYFYGIIITLGIFAAVLYGLHELKKTDITSDDFLNMLIIAIPVSIICARAYYVIFSFDMYKDNLIEVFDIRGGGLAIYGGIIGAAMTVAVYCSAKKLPVGQVLDLLAVGLLIGQAVGRWGNFVNGEAFGTATSLPWAMTVKTDGRLIADCVHPTFLYESLWNFIGIWVILLYKKLRKADGELFCAYLVWYGCGRAMIEGLRTDSLYIGSLRVSQMLAIITALEGILLITYLRRKRVHK